MTPNLIHTIVLSFPPVKQARLEWGSAEAIAPTPLGCGFFVELVVFDFTKTPDLGKDILGRIQYKLETGRLL